MIATNGNFFARVILDRLLSSNKHHVRGVVIVTGDYWGGTGWRALARLAVKTTLPYLAYKLFVIALFKLAGLVLRGDWDVHSLVRYLRIPCLITPEINSSEVESFIANLRPDLLVSVSCPQRIRTHLLEIPSHGALNIHSSLLPAYAGLAPYFWVLAHGKPATGTTVHYMTPQFDQGNVLVQQRCEILARDSAFALFSRLAVLGRDLLPTAVDLAMNGDPGRVQGSTTSSYFSHPDWKSYRSMRRRGHRLIQIRDIVQLLIHGSVVRPSVPIGPAIIAEERPLTSVA